MHSLLGNSRKADLTFHANGRIDISAHVAGKLSLSRGDVIDVVSDGTEYYFYVKARSTTGRYEATVYKSQRNSNHFLAWSRKLCRAMITACGSSSRKVRLAVGQTVTISSIGKALPMITKNPI